MKKFKKAKRNEVFGDLLTIQGYMRKMKLALNDVITMAYSTEAPNKYYQLQLYSMADYVGIASDYLEMTSDKIEDMLGE